MRINNNVAAFNAYRNTTASSNGLSKTLEKLSSGFRINRAADDAAGLVISQNLRAQISGLRTATRNVQDGISVVQTAEGALNEVHSMLTRMRELAVQAANTGTMDNDAVAAADSEVTALVDEIDHISAETTFGSINLLDGSYSGVFQVSQASGDTVTVTVTTLDASTLGVDALTLTGTVSAISAIDSAITAVSTARGDLGAMQNRFESMVNNLQVGVENLTASESRIRDADMALEMVSFTKSQILLQAGTAMMAQANNVPQSVLRLMQ
jgi:flagellin